jgi:hypothetical protein
MRQSFVALLCFLISPVAFGGLVPDPESDNNALIVGVAHNLPGIGNDVEMAKSITEHKAYQFHPASVLQNSKGRVQEVKEALKEGSENAWSTFLFYFSGHGSRGTINLQNGNLSATSIRDVIAEGRKEQGPLGRLVLFFDSCHSGSMADPMRQAFDMKTGMRTIGAAEEEMRDRTESEATANAWMEALTPRRGDPTYWKSLFVFASSRSNELSNAGSNGSAFTVALDKAFKEVVTKRGTIQDWVEKTQSYTHGHHPVARFSPEALAQEPLDITQ